MHEHHMSIYTQVICTLVFSDLLLKVSVEYYAVDNSRIEPFECKLWKLFSVYLR